MPSLGSTEVVVVAQRAWRYCSVQNYVLTVDLQKPTHTKRRRSSFHAEAVVDFYVLYVRAGNSLQTRARYQQH